MAAPLPAFKFVAHKCDSVYHGDCPQLRVGLDIRHIHHAVLHLEGEGLIARQGDIFASPGPQFLYERGLCHDRDLLQTVCIAPGDMVPVLMAEDDHVNAQSCLLLQLLVAALSKNLCRRRVKHKDRVLGCFYVVDHDAQIEVWIEPLAVQVDGSGLNSLRYLVGIIRTTCVAAIYLSSDILNAAEEDVDLILLVLPPEHGT
ncbi:hypothetical protein CRV24_003226 [Beauveria bassiana]|nr:hypothetical protein CRV24_003226 [Beauveria bassiana]KAH8718632.1 hypothetical protein HC256_003263 [Beauveria bassiana]